MVLLYALSGFAAAPQVLVLNDANAPPYTNAERSGFLDIIVGEAFRRAGLELRLEKLPAERALMLANSGIEDGELTCIAGLEKLYPNLLRVPEKLFDFEFTAFSKNAAITTDWPTLRTRSVGIIRGWKIYAEALIGSAGLVTVETAEQLFHLLNLGRIEVALYGRWIGIAHIKQHQLKQVRLLQPTLATREMFIYLNKRHAVHVPTIAAALRALKDGGYYERMYRERITTFAEGQCREFIYAHTGKAQVATRATPRPGHSCVQFGDNPDAHCGPALRRIQAGAERNHN